MKADDIRQYVGQKVLLELSNGYRFYNYNSKFWR